jgi:hypothetical protein
MARRRWQRVVKVALLALAAAFVIAQLIPYGWDHSNPPVVAEPAWDSADTRALAVRACFDCHSNETRWPWYSYVAPTSWLMRKHVDEGREVLNFSRWDRSYPEAGESAEVLLESEMPLESYLMLHPKAKLTAEEKQALARGLTATLGGEGNDGRDDD